jgi:uncharacterized membrane protein
MILWPILSAVVLIVTAVCAAGWVKPNPLVGIRIPATRQSAGAWRAGHRAALTPAMVGTVAVAIASVLSITSSQSDSVWRVVAIASFVAELIWIIVAAQRAATSILPDA